MERAEQEKVRTTPTPKMNTKTIIEDDIATNSEEHRNKTSKHLKQHQNTTTISSKQNHKNNTKIKHVHFSEIIIWDFL